MKKHLTRVLASALALLMVVTIAPIDFALVLAYDHEKRR